MKIVAIIILFIVGICFLLAITFLIIYYLELKKKHEEIRLSNKELIEVSYKLAEKLRKN